MATLIRPMVVGDIKEIVRIEEASHVVPWTTAIFQDCLRVGYENWVLEFEDQIAGFGIMMIAADECHILNLCVDPKHQGQGLGKLLLLYLLQTAQLKQAKSVILEVRKSNQKALNLYEKIGFNMIGDRKNYYPTKTGREDAIMLALDLAVFKLQDHSKSIP